MRLPTCQDGVENRDKVYNCWYHLKYWDENRSNNSLYSWHACQVELTSTMQAGQGSRPVMFFDASILCSLMWESIMAGTSGYIVSRVAEYNENHTLSNSYYSFIDIWNKSYMNCGDEMKMKKWSSQWTQFMQLRKEAWKKFRTSTGFAPMTSRLPVRCSNNWAMKPQTLEAGQLFIYH